MRGGERAWKLGRRPWAATPSSARRALELGTLDARLERAIAGAGSLVMVAGDAGIGKTRMLREFTATARARGALTLWGSSFEGDWHPPYGPWVEALGEAGGRSSAPACARRSAAARPCWPDWCQSWTRPSAATPGRWRR
jgi:AAA ATPase domain